MGRVLNESTVLRNPRNSKVVVLHAGTEVPAWAEDLVGDHLTAGSPEAAGGGATTPPVAPDHVPDEGTAQGTEQTPDSESSQVSEGSGQDTAADNQPPPASDFAPSEPPRAGRGSGVEVWKAYAAAVGVEVPEDANRDAIIELVDEQRPK